MREAGGGGQALVIMVCWQVVKAAVKNLEGKAREDAVGDIRKKISTRSFEVLKRFGGGGDRGENTHSLVKFSCLCCDSSRCRDAFVCGTYLAPFMVLRY